ncbi:NAD-dependent succinate-semialdehyde dehydrogenase [Nocardiopsis synnemataformans]|uniref:NAD-dependent succinate-semialdehyde dehydrogenase n=1 Tax=Nocardiopsis synnemataformans TaxID=61305 RepID=UPI003EBC8A05
MPTSTNPHTGTELATHDFHSPAQVEAALDAAVEAQRRWRTVPVPQRAELLVSVARVLREGREHYARTITLEMGKPVTEARAEVDKSARTLEFYADNAERFLAFEEIASDAEHSGVRFDPLGVVLAIMPWNYPFWQFFRFAAPALAAGNAAVLKHANNVPGCALMLQEIMDRAGTPRGLFSSLLVDTPAVAPLIADDRIAAVTFTGSTQVGAIIASQAGAALKKQVLELGGSDPFIVLADADLEAAAATAARSRFNTVGQSCVNAKRFLVVESVADRFVELFVEEVRALVCGDPLEEATQIGPMARANLRDTLHDQVRRTVEAGAKLLVGGEVPAGPGFHYPPTVLDHVSTDTAAFTEETFGPVAAVTRVADAGEAVRLANASEYGLGAAIWTRDSALGQELATGIEAGAVFVNGQVASDPRLPFGGIKKSGYGRELSVYGIREFVNVKTLWIGSAHQ